MTPDTTADDGLTVRGFETILSLDAILGDHAHKSRRAGFVDVSDRMCAVQQVAIDAECRVIGGDVNRSALTVEFDADQTACISEACVYAIEGAHDLAGRHVETAHGICARLED